MRQQKDILLLCLLSLHWMLIFFWLFLCVNPWKDLIFYENFPSLPITLAEIWLDLQWAILFRHTKQLLLGNKHVFSCWIICLSLLNQRVPSTLTYTILLCATQSLKSYIWDIIIPILCIRKSRCRKAKTAVKRTQLESNYVR